MLTITEENYLKAIFKIAERDGLTVNTNAVAAAVLTTAASVTDMLKRLSEKHLLTYEKYKGVQLTKEGETIAIRLIRKHRLWEVFLVDKLGFNWDEVHDLAEQLEHIQGDELIRRLDAYLDHPHYDPHGDPIPNEAGTWSVRSQIPLSELPIGQEAIITGVNDHSASYLQYLQQLGLTLGVRLQVAERVDYDHSMRINITNGPEMTLSEKAGTNLFVKIQ